MGRPEARIFSGARGVSISATEFGPPDKITAFGCISSNAFRAIKRHNLAIHAAFTHPPRNQLRHASRNRRSICDPYVSPFVSARFVYQLRQFICRHAWRVANGRSRLSAVSASSIWPRSAAYSPCKRKPPNHPVQFQTDRYEAQPLILIAERGLRLAFK